MGTLGYIQSLQPHRRTLYFYQNKKVCIIDQTYRVKDFSCITEIAFKNKKIVKIQL